MTSISRIGRRLLLQFGHCARWVAFGAWRHRTLPPLAWKIAPIDFDHSCPAPLASFRSSILIGLSFFFFFFFFFFFLLLLLLLLFFVCVCVCVCVRVFARRQVVLWLIYLLMLHV